MANHADIVMATIAKALDVPLNVVGSNINIKDTLSAHGAGMTQMAAALEETFGICIAYDDAEQFTTTQDVVDYVGSKVWWYNP